MGMHKLTFAKYEGLGNDFLIVELDPKDMPAARARKLCDRHFGVGADGVLVVQPGGSIAGRMTVMNADGSQPEMCGNGLRCVALYLARTEGMRRGEIVVRTDAGDKKCFVDDEAGAGIVTIDMGEVKVLGDRALDVDGQTMTFAIADAGNPHAVIFGAADEALARRVGPRVATRADFPQGTNVEFARFDRGAIDLVVWERGVGLTLACGTGACATAAVAVSKGLAQAGKPIPVRLPGGELTVTIANGVATMRGPARHVFDGGVIDL